MSPAPADLKRQLATSDVTSVTSVTNATLVTTCHKNVTTCHKNIGPNPDNLIDKVREWLQNSDGVFNYQELARDLQIIKNLKALQNLRKILSRLTKDEVIERVGLKSGNYRRIENEVEFLDWAAASTDEYEIRLPLELDVLAKIHPQNIIVFAGESNTAKTGLCLETARLNLHDHKIRYQCSEMGAEELAGRLRLFENVDLDLWHRVEFVPRSENFQDLILPDDLNIVDFIEIHEDFWRVGGMLKAIHDKLRGGVCIAAIQKKPGADVGKGGYMTLEKPRIYVSVSLEKEPDGTVYNTARIVKCKSPRNKDRDPNAMQMDFKLIGGWKLFPMTGWRHVKR
jgi:hypothetical protein